MGIIYKSVAHGLDSFVIKPKQSTNSVAYKLLVKAEALRLANHFKESIKHYLGSILLDRKSHKAYLGLGISYKSQENYDKAIKALEAARKISYFTPEIHYELGLCYMMVGRLCEAIRCFHHTISLDRTNLNAQLQLGVAHELIEETDMAILIYHTIIENHPEFLSAYNHLSALYMNLGEFKSAGSVFSQVLKINPNYNKAYLGLAICFDRMSNTSRAIHYYKAFLDKKPHSHHGPKIKTRITKLQNSKLQSQDVDFRAFAVV